MNNTGQTHLLKRNNVKLVPAKVCPIAWCRSFTMTHNKTKTFVRLFRNKGSCIVHLWIYDVEAA